MGKTLLVLFVFGMVFGMAQSVLAEHPSRSTLKVDCWDTNIFMFDRNNFEKEVATWRKSCENFNLALIFGPKPFLRAASSRWPEFALEYALYIDRGFHPATFKGACKDIHSKTCSLYKLRVGMK